MIRQWPLFSNNLRWLSLVNILLNVLLQVPREAVNLVWHMLPPIVGQTRLPSVLTLSCSGVGQKLRLPLAKLLNVSPNTWTTLVDLPPMT